MKRDRWILRVAALGLLASPPIHMAAAAGVCASTPAAALVAAKGSVGTPLAELHGFRVEAVRWDPVLRRAWAVIESCDHRERPSFTVLTDLPVAPPLSVPPLETSRHLGTLQTRWQAAMPIVHAGELVRLWKIESYSHIELIATSEENGAIGSRVRLRLVAPKNSDGQTSPPQYLAGVVRGPADVEMEP